jgi:transcriptional regulator GlxA family with amidase domain
MPNPNPLRVGVLLVDAVQLLDIAAVDLLFMTDPEYIKAIGMPKPMQELGRTCQVHYIGRGGAKEHSPVTANMELSLTDSLTSPAVRPGQLDVLFIPGPPPDNMPCGDDYLEFLREHFKAGAEIMSVCTAALVIAYSGITKGRVATAPRFLIPRLQKEFPDTKLWDDSMRIVRDGNIWSCGMLSVYILRDTAWLTIG